jgi:uncharacterized protein (TIGR02300 family)
VAKPEWGTKQTCPKCGTRFYDLEKEPAVCVSCGHSFVPEPILKSKQPMPADEAKPEKKKKDDDDDIELDDDDDIDVDDDDVADVSLDDDDADLSDVVDTKLDDDDE